MPCTLRPLKCQNCAHFSATQIPASEYRRLSFGSAMARLRSPHRDELFRNAIESARRDGTANSAGVELKELNDSMRELCNTAVGLANWDEPPTTYTVEWNASKARQNHAMERVWPLCPPKLIEVQESGTSPARSSVVDGGGGAISWTSAKSTQSSGRPGRSSTSQRRKPGLAHTSRAASTSGTRLG